MDELSFEMCESSFRVSAYYLSLLINGLLEVWLGLLTFYLRSLIYFLHVWFSSFQTLLPYIWFNFFVIYHFLKLVNINLRNSPETLWVLPPWCFFKDIFFSKVMPWYFYTGKVLYNHSHATSLHMIFWICYSLKTSQMDLARLKVRKKFTISK